MGYKSTPFFLKIKFAHEINSLQFLLTASTRLFYNEVGNRQDHLKRSNVEIYPGAVFLIKKKKKVAFHNGQYLATHPVCIYFYSNESNLQTLAPHTYADNSGDSEVTSTKEF